MKIQSRPHQVFDDGDETNKELSITDELEATAAAETAIAMRYEHALQRIEARCEEKRVNDLLTEVYEQE